jgi:hypothetical protein
MSSRNSETDGMIFALAIVATIAFFMFAVIYALLVFGALLFTILALAAWDKPATLFGETLQPHEARAYVGRGVAGAVLVPVFLTFCQTLFSFTMPDKYWVYIVLGGYAAGSLGIEVLMAEENAKKAEVEVLPPLRDNVVPLRVVPRERQADEPFEYASWDDEEERT